MVDKRELKKKSRGELVRMCDGAGLDHTGSDEQLISRLIEAHVEPEPVPSDPEQ